MESEKSYDLWSGCQLGKNRGRFKMAITVCDQQDWSFDTRNRPASRAKTNWLAYGYGIDTDEDEDEEGKEHYSKWKFWITQERGSYNALKNVLVGSIITVTNPVIRENWHHDLQPDIPYAIEGFDELQHVINEPFPSALAREIVAEALAPAIVHCVDNGDNERSIVQSVAVTFASGKVRTRQLEVDEHQICYARTTLDNKHQLAIICFRKSAARQNTFWHHDLEVVLSRMNATGGVILHNVLLQEEAVKDNNGTTVDYRKSLRYVQTSYVTDYSVLHGVDLTDLEDAMCGVDIRRTRGEQFAQLLPTQTACVMGLTTMKSELGRWVVDMKAVELNYRGETRMPESEERAHQAFIEFDRVADHTAAETDYRIYMRKDICCEVWGGQRRKTLTWDIKAVVETRAVNGRQTYRDRIITITEMVPSEQLYSRGHASSGGTDAFVIGSPVRVTDTNRVQVLATVKTVISDAADQSKYMVQDFCGEEWVASFVPGVTLMCNDVFETIVPRQHRDHPVTIFGPHVVPSDPGRQIRFQNTFRALEESVEASQDCKGKAEPVLPPVNRTTKLSPDALQELPAKSAFMQWDQEQLWRKVFAHIDTAAVASAFMKAHTLCGLDVLHYKHSEIHPFLRHPTMVNVMQQITKFYAGVGSHADRYQDLFSCSPWTLSSVDLCRILISSDLSSDLRPFFWELRKACVDGRDLVRLSAAHASRTTAANEVRRKFMKVFCGREDLLIKMEAISLAARRKFRLPGAAEETGEYGCDNSQTHTGAESHKRGSVVLPSGEDQVTKRHKID
jgi:hypothetical protein